MTQVAIEAKRLHVNPSPEELRAMTAEMPNARPTAYENLNVKTRVVARSKASTFIVTDSPGDHDDQTITREEGERVARLQDDYIRGQEMLQIDGFIGNDPEFRTAARLVIERANANVAAMQQILYFPATDEEKASFVPETTVIYTPNLAIEGYPNDRLIAVDLERNVTRVMNSDYFGESKKGGLRKWNKIVYDRGGLSLHAGCKVIPVGDGRKVGLIVGLSGTGKTTTTFTRQNDSGPVQDDFCALMPGGKVYATENGCFAKTFALDPEFEPTIHGAVVGPQAYLENVSQKEDGGDVDFFDTGYTKNGRAVFPMSAVAGALDARNLGKADFLLILNRNENIIPAVARLTGAQAAAYFMLGETQGTSAGGAEEAGKFLRVPGTNPFFPLRHFMQGNRLLELMASSPMEVFLMNTGRVGGAEGDDRSRKVKIPHSSAVVKGIAEGTISWESDPDFGYEVATAVPGIAEEDLGLLQPRRHYEVQGRQEEYASAVRGLKEERVAYMEKWANLDESIVAAIRCRDRMDIAGAPGPPEPAGREAPTIPRSRPDTKRLTTLGLLVKAGRVLLMRRKKEPNRGLLVPPGGKIRLKESPHECVVREVAEETGLTPVDPRLRGVITQVAPVAGQQWMLFVYRADRWSGRLRRGHREGEPQWVPLEAIRRGEADIPDADRVFLPRLLGPGRAVIEMKFHHRRDLSVARWEEGPR